LRTLPVKNAESTHVVPLRLYLFLQHQTLSLIQMRKNHKTISIIIADDHELFRKGFGLLLKEEKQFNLLGEAENGEELVKLAKKFKPDIVITDIRMPRMDGIAATRILQKELPKTHIIALSVFGDEVSILHMLEAGAIGFLDKAADHIEIVTAIQAAMNNQNYFSRNCSESLQQGALNHAIKGGKANLNSLFTEKELAIIKLIYEELTSAEIAKKLNVSIRTVETHRRNILIKTDTKNTVGIVKFAIKNKIFEY
jgi:DNA-binding NarL/FixJ family response regulator